MLFNSVEFIFFFLPISLLGFLWLGKAKLFEITMSWLIICSLFFYGWWNPSYLILICSSMVLNFSLGKLIQNTSKTNRRIALYLGVVLNLALLGYFKYANFFVVQLSLITGNSYHFDTIILPLAISFFTFQQIAYLVDVSRGETKEYSFRHYCLFVIFFPQLIAGPIVHHKQMMPQFMSNKTYQFNNKLFVLGIIMFTIGLAKKMLLADNMATYAIPVFGAVELGTSLNFFEAWGGAIAYSLQLYFDFSGYSDMAIGIALMFGIMLPINFDSPYKSVSIIEFWRRWHITLSTFLRDYLYFSLGGNRKGALRRYLNLFLTMLLGGLWHGAGWTFVVWGVLHGMYLVINHGWRKIRFEYLSALGKVSKIEVFAARLITLMAILVGWVYFRAESVASANQMILMMFAPENILIPLEWKDILKVVWSVDTSSFSQGTTRIAGGAMLILCILFIALYLPNSQYISEKMIEIMSTFNASDSRSYKTYAFGALAGLIFSFCVLNLSQVSEFLYFQF